MLCHQCGSPVQASDSACPNCGAALKSTRRFDIASSKGLRISQQMKAIRLDKQVFPPGELLTGRYKLGEMVGKGPFGEAYRALDSDVDDDVCVKVFEKSLIEKKADEERFLNATRLARGLTQQNIVRVHDSGVHKGHPWVSMQFLEGLTLRKVMGLRLSKGEYFTVEELEPVVSQIAAALQQVERDTPHGDLKPENVIFLPDLIKVSDAYVFSAVPREAFAERLSENTYLAPELHTPDADADARADVYSLGLIIGEMVFGPDYTPGSRAETELAGIDALCKRATAFDPAERYPSVEALAEDLTTLVDTGALLAPPPPAPPAAPAPPPAPGSDAPMPPPAPPAAGVDEGEVEPPLSPPAPPSAGDEEGEVESPMPPPAPGAPASDEDATPELDEDIPPPPIAPNEVSTLELDIDDDAIEFEEEAPEPEPKVEDKETVEYSRGEGELEIQDVLPTNEVQRDLLPPPEPRRNMVTKTHISRPEDDDDSMMAYAIGAVILVAVILGVMFAVSGGSKKEVVTIGGGKDKAKVEKKAATSTAPKKDEDASAAKAVDAGAAVAITQPDAGNAAVEAAAAPDAGTADAGKATEVAVESPTPTVETTQGAQVAPKTSTEKTGTTAPAAGAKTSGATATAAKTEAPKPKTGTTCPPGMVLIKSKSLGNYCIDVFEYPARGVKPRTRVNWFQAKKECTAKGRRLCKLKEWRSACGSRYPYGRRFDSERCNTVDEDGFERSLSAAGSFKRCRSRSGAYDMTGNVHEWVEERRIVGGSYESDEDVASCRYSSAKAPGSSGADIGFRCCADPE